MLPGCISVLYCFNQSDKVKELKEKLSEFEKRNRKLNDNLTDMSVKLEEVELELERVTQTNSVLERRVCQLDKDNSELSTQCDDQVKLQDRITAVTGEKDRLLEDYEVIKKQSDSLQLELIEHDSRYNKLDSEYQQQKDQIKQCKIEEDRLLDRVAQLEAELTQKTASETELLIDRDNVKSQLQYVTSQWQSLKSNYEQLQSDYKTLQNTVVSLRSERKMDELKIEQLEKQTSKLEETVDQLKSETIKLNIEKTTLTDTNSELTNQCEELTGEVERLQTRCNHLRKEFDFVKSISRVSSH